MTARHRLAIAVAALALAAPPAASAQTPGDDQYTDPFGGSTPSQPEQSDNGAGQPAEPAPSDEDQGSSGGGSPDEGAAQQAPAAEPAPVSASQTVQPPSAGPQLPRTGADAGLIAAGGALLLTGGVVLRVRISERALRRRTSWRADRA